MRLNSWVIANSSSDSDIMFMSLFFIEIKESVKTDSEAKLSLADVVSGEIVSPSYNASDLKEKLSTPVAPTLPDDNAELLGVNADNDQLSPTSAQSEPHSGVKQRLPPTYSGSAVRVLPGNDELEKPMSLQSHYGHQRPPQKYSGYENRPEPENYGPLRSTSPQSESVVYSVNEDRHPPSYTNSDQKVRPAYSESEDKPVPIHQASEPVASRSGKQGPLAEGANSSEQMSGSLHSSTDYRPLPSHFDTKEPTGIPISLEYKPLAAYSEFEERLLPVHYVSEEVLSLPSSFGKHIQLPASIGSADRPSYSESPQRPLSTYLKSEVRQAAASSENHRDLLEYSTSNSVQRRPAYPGPKYDNSEVRTVLESPRPERRRPVYSETEETAFSETEEHRSLLPAHLEKERPANHGSENEQLNPANSTKARPLPDYSRSEVGQFPTYPTSKEEPIPVHAGERRPLPINAKPVERQLSLSEGRPLPAYTGTQPRPLLTYYRDDERPRPALSATRPLPAYTGAGSEQRPLPAYYSRPDQRPLGLHTHFGTEGEQRPLPGQGGQSIEYNISKAGPLRDSPVPGQRPLRVHAYSESPEPLSPVHPLFASSYDRTQSSKPVSEANVTVHRQLYQETVYGFPYKSREIFFEPDEDIDATGKTASYIK